MAAVYNDDKKISDYEQKTSGVESALQECARQSRNSEKAVPLTEQAMRQFILQLAVQQQQITSQKSIRDTLVSGLRSDLTRVEGWHANLKKDHEQSKSKVTECSRKHNKCVESIKTTRQELRKLEREFKKSLQELKNLEQRDEKIRPVLDLKDKMDEAQQFSEDSQRRVRDLEQRLSTLKEKRQMLLDEFKINWRQRLNSPDICKPRMDEIKAEMVENIKLSRTVRDELHLAKAKMHRYDVQKHTAHIALIDAKATLKHADKPIAQDPILEHQSLIEKANTIRAQQQARAAKINEKKNVLETQLDEKAKAKSDLNAAKEESGKISKALKGHERYLKKYTVLEGKMETLSDKLDHIQNQIKQTIEKLKIGLSNLWKSGRSTNPIAEGQSLHQDTESALHPNNDKFAPKS